MEIALHLELWMLEEGELSLAEMHSLSDEAACMMAYFPEIDSIEAESLAMLLFYCNKDNRIAPADAIPLVLGDTDFAWHFLRCSEDQNYWDRYLMVASAGDVFVEEHTYLDENVAFFDDFFV